mgnify:CR=1 FL=1
MSDKPIQQSHRPLEWADAQTGTTVFSASNDKPYIVDDPVTKTLRTPGTSIIIACADDHLRLKNGPVIVVATNFDQLIGVYTDISAEVLVVDAGNGNVQHRRPKVLQQLPVIHTSLLDNFIAGSGTLPRILHTNVTGWDVVRVIADEETKTRSFALTNRLLVNALAAELIRLQLSFNIVADPNPLPGTGRWEFTVTDDVFHRIHSQCVDVIGGAQNDVAM